MLPKPQATSEEMDYSMFVLGFGFDVQNIEYKVVRITYIHEDYGYAVPPAVDVYGFTPGIGTKLMGKFLLIV
ncbi:hypothetical protein BUALT_Bualt16G0062700 [Buddleja alternifolia]|uniref:Uncharacterized protein n=1 Tax=Buddleja alternifolia TaxID=168488 RepID=A0AAV6WG37_9LAMI|nr:hypothetical protein BUALT_Bualt16G0062700 [Buddleja alternifolia]